jgi:hypothetical protein
MHGLQRSEGFRRPEDHSPGIHIKICSTRLRKLCSENRILPNIALRVAPPAAYYYEGKLASDVN